MAALSQVSKTLLYSDIFDYPLTLAQVWKYLISDKKVSQEKVEKLLRSGEIEYKNGFYFLRNRKKIVSFRQAREKESSKKIKLAREVAKQLELIPTIKFLAISGSVSMENADRDDDIDLFVVCKKDSVWLTRLLIILFLKSRGIYRSRDEKNPKNKFCLNMIIDENNLNFPTIRQNIYLAHEIAQVLPLFSRDKTYYKFMNSNEWIKKYLANFEKKIVEETNSGFSSHLLENFLKILRFEKVAKFIQGKYMRKPKGDEIIAQGFLAFHPKDYSSQVLKAYKTRLKINAFKTLGH